MGLLPVILSILSLYSCEDIHALTTSRMVVVLYFIWMNHGWQNGVESSDKRDSFEVDLDEEFKSPVCRHSNGV